MRWAALALSAVVLLFAGGCAAIMSWFSSQPDWLLFDVSELRDYYYNPGQAEHLSKNTVKVAIATVARSEEGKNWEVSERMKRGLPLGGYEKYYSSEDVYLLDCETRKFQTLSGVDYDETGKALSTYTAEDPSWEGVPSGSSIETLMAYKSVCP
jgi:hypothetical protein